MVAALGWVLLAGVVARASYWITKRLLIACFGVNINLSCVDHDGVKRTKRIRVKGSSGLT